MARRQKTRFEKFFSFNQRKKRFGAAKFKQNDVNFSELKALILDLGEPVQTYGSDKSLEGHFGNLKREFSGQSELLFYHAQLIVLLRREFELADTYSKFKTLWAEEGEFLCEHLNIRWLVSACETFTDHDADQRLQAVAFQGSMLANIIKIYETERKLTGTEDAAIDQDKAERLHDDLLPLFEGMSCFAIGTDDTLRHLRWRLDKMFDEPIVGPILKTIFDRMQNEDTAFHRMKLRHKRDKTAWW